MADSPAQQAMGGAIIDNKAYRALQEANLVCDKYLIKGFDSIDSIPGKWDVTQSMCLHACCWLTCQCCCTLQFTTVDPGCVQVGSHSDGTNLFFGPGVHVLCKLWKRARGRPR